MSDLLFHRGRIFDGHHFLSPGTSVLVRDGRIAAVGSDIATPASEPIDLQGGTLLPGFIDAHAHPVFAGQQLRHCDLRTGANQVDYLRIIAAYAAEHPGEPWITGGGWSMDAFSHGIPTRDLLDDIVPDRPVYLPNRDGHGAWVNSRALELAGIDRTTPDPADGRIERDERGEPVGMLQEGAAELVSRLLPPAGPDDWYQALQSAQQHLLGLGITGWQDAIVGDYAAGGADPLPAYVRAAGDGTLKVNVKGALWWDRERGLEQLPELEGRRRIGDAGRFVATSVKMMLDGVAETHTAAMLEPYLDHDGCESDHSGLDFIDPDELPRYVSALDATGFQVHFHALGDRAVRHALDAIEAAQQANGRNGIRHHLAHLQVVHPDDIERFRTIGATANIQALWAAHEPQMDELTIPFLGKRRAGWQYPFRSIRDTGAALCAGSDWPVSSPNPLWGIHVAVNRSLPVAGGDPFLPEQALPREAALAAYTSGSARVNGWEGERGSIAVGLDADFAVVDADLADIADRELGQATVMSTWVRGSHAA